MILSGFSDFSYAQEALRFGAADYLTKPVNLKEVESLLDRLRAEVSGKAAGIRNSHPPFGGTFLLSAAKGYASDDISQYRFPVLNRWYGLSMALLDRDLSEDEIAAKKDQMSLQIPPFCPLLWY